MFTEMHFNENTLKNYKALLHIMTKCNSVKTLLNMY